jgi:hypothetical protein
MKSRFPAALRIFRRKPAPAPPPADTRCTATTKAGTRCKLPAWRGGLCRRHAAGQP